MLKSSTTELKSDKNDVKVKHPRLSTINILRGFARACMPGVGCCAGGLIMN